MTNTTAKTLLFSALPLLLLPANTLAQIAADGTTSTTVTPTATGVQIDNGDRSGGNLFHSFQDFSIPTGTEAHFNNANDIANIFSRVTGSNVSDIDGLIRANGTANLFLINPNGIIFGENASLQLGGSFFATTADGILFDDDVAFSASDPTTPLLTSSIPVGANFRDNPGSIINKSTASSPSNIIPGIGELPDIGDIPGIGELPDIGDILNNTVGLQVNEGKSLILLGGDVDFEGGNVNVSGGTVEIGGLAEAGTVGLLVDGNALSLNFSEANQLANVTLSNRGNINASNITITPGQLTLESGGKILGLNLNNDDPGSIKIKSATEVNLKGDLSDVLGLNQTSILASTDENATVNIDIETDKLKLNDGAFISTDVNGSADAGDIFIQASDIELIGIGELLPTRITAQVNLGLNDNGASGAGGEITINTERLNIKDGAAIFASTSSSGDAGSVKIRGLNSTDSIVFFAEEVVLSGFGERQLEEDTTLKLPSRILAQVNRPNDANDNQPITGNAGEVQIDTQKLKILDGATISTATFSEGIAGDVTINASESVELIGSPITEDRQLSGSLFAGVGRDAIGSGGTVTVNTESLIVRENADVNVSSIGEGDPGNLDINASSDLSLEDGGSLTAESATGKGGNIDITSNDILLRNESLISASGSDDEPTLEGNITISGETLILFDNSSIITSAFDPEGGSNIEIPGKELFILQSQNSTINAEGELNIETDLEVDPPEVPQVEIVDPSNQITQNPCEQGVGSEFLVTGKGGFPANPQNNFSSNEMRVGLVKSVTPESQTATVDTVEKNSNTSTEEATIVPAQGWILNDEGKLVLTAYDPTNQGVQRTQKSFTGCSVSHNQPQQQD